MPDQTEMAMASFQIANECHRKFTAALLNFQAACLSHNWRLAEQFQVEAVGALEAHLDNLAVGYKVIP